MRFAALFDIHANLPALEAVLVDVRQERVDLIVVGGDVLPGPMPRETMALLRTIYLPVRCILGNGDREVLAVLNGGEASGVPAKFRHLIDWNAAQLGATDASELASWPATLTLDTDVGRILFCHATPWSDTDIFTVRTPDELLAPVLRGVRADIVVCGHTHMQFDRTVGDIRIVNAGSVGMPYGEPGAYWLLIDDEIALRRTEYELMDAAERIRASGYPEAEDFAQNNVLLPASEEGAFTVFKTTSPLATGLDANKRSV